MFARVFGVAMPFLRYYACFVHFRHNRHTHLLWVLLVCVRVLSETNGNSYIHIFQMAKVRKEHEIKMTIVKSSSILFI